MKHQSAVLVLTAAVLILVGTAVFAGVSVAEGLMGLVNPWVELTPYELWQTAGVRLQIPSGISGFSCRHLTPLGTSEMQFTLDGQHWNVRVQPADRWTGISGLYYRWQATEPCTVQRCEGQLMWASEGDERIGLCLWYNAAAGRMYALSVIAKAADTPDLIAMANLLLDPAEALSADVLQQFLMDCTGYAGSAGASLKRAQAAVRALTFAAEHRLADADAHLLTAALQDAWDGLGEAAQEELRWNLPRINDLLISLQQGDSDAHALLQDTDAAPTSLITDADAHRHWRALYALLEALTSAN